MKSIKIFVAGCGIMSTFLLVQSCKKDLHQKLPENSDFSNSATAQLYNAVVNSNKNYLYVDGKALNGATIAYGSSFPLTGSSFVVPSGLRGFQVKDTSSSTTQLPLVFSESLQVNKYYTIFTYDTTTSPKHITVLTTIETPTDTTARVRFANFVFSKTAVPAVDIFSKRRNANVFTNIQITEVTDFIPYASALTDTLLVRETGTTNQLAQLNGFSPTQKRSYTLVFRGRYQSTTTAVARTLSSFVNH